MVTIVQERQRTVVELGQELGVDIVIRPWWGSRRQTHEARHRKCNGLVYEDHGSLWCSQCHTRFYARKEFYYQKVPTNYLCPSGYTGAQMRQPEVQGNKVVMWQGRCGARYSNGLQHEHQQTIEVLDFDPGEHAMLVRMRRSAKMASAPTLVGLDDWHPWAHIVPGKCTTVQDGLDWLVPLKVREALILGTGVVRQGDWFFVPHSKPVVVKEEIPWRTTWYSPNLTADNYAVSTMIRWPEVNIHRVFLNGPLMYPHAFRPTRHIAERIIYRTTPQPLVMGTVTAPDHPPVHLATWHQAVRNRHTPWANDDGAD